MATYDASIKKAVSPQQADLIEHKEHCSADRKMLETVGRLPGHQIRIKSNEDEYGLYTVSVVCQESPDNIVCMGQGGRIAEGGARKDMDGPHHRPDEPFNMASEPGSCWRAVDELDSIFAAGSLWCEGMELGPVIAM